MILKIGLLLMVLAPLIWYKAGTTIYKRFGGEAKKMEQVMQAPQGDVAVAGYGGQFGQQARPMTTSEYVATFEPRVDGLQHTAPRYDELTKPTRVPLPVGCLKTAKRCDCFTQDATPYKTTPELCQQFVEKGFFIDFPTEQNQQAQPEQKQQPTVAHAPEGPRFVGIQHTPTPLMARTSVTGSGS